MFSNGIGLPQGGVCSAKFWLIAFDFAIKIINMLKIEGNGYADDCSALYGGPRLDHALSRLQKMLDTLTSWGRRCGLRFNPEKSVAVLFTRRHKTPPKALKIDGKEIPYQNEVKYLGVTLDAKLHWKKHVQNKIDKTKKFLSNIAQITRKNWGPKPKLMRWAYLGVVRPSLSYASLIWGHRASFSEDKLRKLNRLAINTFGSFPKSTPTRALEIMLDIMPLHLFCEQEALASRVRLDDVLDLDWDGTNQKKTHAVGHLKYWDDLLSSSDIDPSTSDRCSEIIWPTGFRLNKDSFSGLAKHRALSQYNIFTDGSRSGGQTGAGAIIYRGKQEILQIKNRLPNTSSVFQAEIFAIGTAASTLIDRNETNMKFVKIFVDSQAALLAISCLLYTSPSPRDRQKSRMPSSA